MAIRQELEDHLLQKVEDLAEDGLPREEAILKALRQHGPPRAIGYRLRSPFPWIDIRTQGTARGVIAIGPRAEGIFAFGGIAVGVFAFGVLAIGVFSFGGVSVGFCSAGGLALAWGTLQRGIFSAPNVVYVGISMLAGTALALLENHRGKADWLIEG